MRPDNLFSLLGSKYPGPLELHLYQSPTLQSPLQSLLKHPVKLGLFATPTTTSQGKLKGNSSPL